MSHLSKLTGDLVNELPILAQELCDAAVAYDDAVMMADGEDGPEVQIAGTVLLAATSRWRAGAMLARIHGLRLAAVRA